MWLQIRYVEEPWSSGYGGGSCLEGREFESQNHILNEHFSHLFVLRIVMFVWKDENKQKEAEDGSF